LEGLISDTILGSAQRRIFKHLRPPSRLWPLPPSGCRLPIQGSELVELLFRPSSDRISVARSSLLLFRRPDLAKLRSISRRTWRRARCSERAVEVPRRFRAAAISAPSRARPNERSCRYRCHLAAGSGQEARSLIQGSQVTNRSGLCRCVR